MIGLCQLHLGTARTTRGHFEKDAILNESTLALLGDTMRYGYRGGLVLANTRTRQVCGGLGLIEF